MLMVLPGNSGFCPIVQKCAFLPNGHSNFDFTGVCVRVCAHGMFVLAVSVLQCESITYKKVKVCCLQTFIYINRQNKDVQIV